MSNLDVELGDSDLSAWVVATMIGALVLVIDEAANGAVVRLDFVRPEGRPGGRTWQGLDVHWRNTPSMDAVSSQIARYGRGELKCFDVPLAPRGGNSFNREVWRRLSELVPFGEVASYGEVARMLGRPSAARAVGYANARNPISLIVPCHRVIGANGKLIGYGGGEGIATKRALLEHEARYHDKQNGLLL